MSGLMSWFVFRSLNGGQRTKQRGARGGDSNVWKVIMGMDAGEISWQVERCCVEREGDGVMKDC